MQLSINEEMTQMTRYYIKAKRLLCYVESAGDRRNDIKRWHQLGE